MDKHSFIQSKISLLENISVGLLLVLSFLLPIFFIPSSFIPLQFGSSLLFAFAVIFTLIFYIVLTFMRGTVELPQSNPYTFLLIVLVPLVSIISSYASGISRMSIFGYTFDQNSVGCMMLCFLFMFLVSIFFRHRERIFYVYSVIIVSTLVSSLFLISRFIFGTSFLSFGIFTQSISSVLGPWSSVGIFFGISGLLSLVTYEMLPLQRFMKGMLLATLAFSLFFLAVVNFKSIWILFICVSVFFIVYTMCVVDFSPLESRIDRLKKVSPYSFAVLILSFIFLFSPLGQSIATRLHVSSLEVRPSLSITYGIFTHTFAEHHFFGPGPGTFNREWTAYRPLDVNNTIFWNTDFNYGVGLLPTFAVTTGALGILSWLIFLGTYLWLGFLALFKRNIESFPRYLLVSSFCVSLYLWIINCLYVSSMVVWVFTFLFTGLFLAGLYSEHILETKSISLSFRSKKGILYVAVLILCVVPSLVCAYTLYRTALSMSYYQRSVSVANSSNDLSQAEIFIEKAVALVPYDMYYRTQADISIQNIHSLLSQDLSKADTSTVASTFSAELSHGLVAALHARDADIHNYLNWMELGTVYDVAVPAQTKINGAYESAKAAYMEAQKINPNDPEINLALGELEVHNGNLSGAKTYALAAIGQKQNYSDAYFLLTQIEVAQNDIGGAISSVGGALNIDPTNPALYFELGLLQYNQNDFTGAISALQKALSLAPDYANAQYFLGLSFAKIGDMSNALAQFTVLKKSNPTNIDVDFVLNNLKAGKSPFTNAKPPVNSAPEKASSLPVGE